jgi:hypothetical protein
MRKTSSRRTRTPELEAFDRRRIDLARFRPDLSTKDIAALLGGSQLPPSPFLPIETLSVTRTVGRGRTNLTFIRPTIVQADAAVPSATFDRRVSPSRNPVIQMHFEPGAYGITSVGTYLMEFAIQAFGQSTFTLQGFAGSGAVLNAGTKVLNGQVRVSLVLQNVQSWQHTFGFLEQTAGVAWSWFSAQVRFPPPVITQ